MIVALWVVDVRVEKGFGQRLAERLGTELSRGRLGGAKNTHAHTDKCAANVFR